MKRKPKTAMGRFYKDANKENNIRFYFHITNELRPEHNSVFMSESTKLMLFFQYKKQLQTIRY